MSVFGGLWKYENNQNALVHPKTECGCPRGGGIKNRHIHYPSYEGTQKKTSRRWNVAAQVSGGGTNTHKNSCHIHNWVSSFMGLLPMEERRNRSQMFEVGYKQKIDRHLLNVLCLAMKTVKQAPEEFMGILLPPRPEVLADDWKQSMPTSQHAGIGPII